ncbi:uncharacterized protein EV154DRAFT_173542 [Mucor mucedo]|uniref:uncharacterized protein n=1 Tax=Mucor mucedo TaxID=29922 RepID=UPI002220F577|nr:uncharacterized protein EV154DRAFT_173542 [Mucor mucedo]KAI7896779.1 hypothetical protein EV154DRAFT_173542 [Mucor mucedo]
MLKKTDIHDQDYLFYGILDFVSKVDENKTKYILKDDFLKWRTSLIKKATYSDETPNTAYHFTKSILRASDFDEAKAKEKEAIKSLQKDDIEYKQKKKCLQLLKLQRKRYKEKLPDENEYSFIISYFSKVFTTVFDAKKNFWQYKWGEFKLAASKEEENLAKTDDQNRAQGSSIDCIVSSKELGLDFVLLEVSGSMDKEDYVHFLKDRLKIAKNLKYIFKSCFAWKTK